MKVLELSFLTKLPVLSSDGIWFEVDTPLGRRWLKKEDADIETPVKGSGDDIVQTGEAFLNLPYLWGGMSGFGYDCSGFVFNMLKANGRSAPRDAGDQANGGEEVSFSSPKRGDLLFFAYEEGKGRVHHVGIYRGNGEMLHSPKRENRLRSYLLKAQFMKRAVCHQALFLIRTGGLACKRALY